MEPMTLGSPMGSPAQTPGSPSCSSAYLPGFLLGDNTTPARLSISNANDPSRYPNIGSNLPSPISSYSSSDYRHNRQKAIFANTTSPVGSPRVGSENHTGGPPTKGLFDNLDTPQPSETFISTSNRSLSRNQCRSILNNGNDPFYMENISNIGNNDAAQGLLRWITVFGFPPDALNTVLSHISNRVRIVDKHSAPHSQSNWIHLKCATEQEAQRALACNGNIVSGSIMIGVTPCMDEGVILNVEKENRGMNGSMRIFSSPTKMNQSTGDSGNILRTPRIQNARPLAVGYSQHLSPQTVRSPENIPQKSTGLVSKAMEYVFGW
ncbi:hypothetical protein PV327_004312 [Microctonus hyperodae]|uniref:Nucleoporin NUP53 n=1 Tax=Microctonus hyperodae TaxID=165561 RepID=A0AA39FC58_MICHY|nr:hypothetical protein PV327_004312 [Microctonus hyperodae]